MRTRPLVALVALLALPGLQGSPSAAAVDHYVKGRALFDRMALAEAADHFAIAVVERQRDADVWAWLAETYRRLGRTEDARKAARQAVQLDSCHAFALCVLGDNFNPQYGEWEGADPESCWHYLNRATACDSTEGGAWLSIVLEAMRRDDRAAERAAYRALARDRYFTPAIMAHARWMLGGLPDSAVLVVNGDMDYYPLRQLQGIEGFRQDVEIINVSMLNLPWYRLATCRPDRVSSPFSDLVEIPTTLDWKGAEVLPGRRVVEGWIAMVEAGTLGRPLTLAITLADPHFTQHQEMQMVLEGAFWQILPDTTELDADTTSIRRGLTALTPEDFGPPWVSARDRSPVRKMASSRLGDNPIAVAQFYHSTCIELHSKPQAEAIKAWAVDFARRAKVDPERQVSIKDW